LSPRDINSLSDLRRRPARVKEMRLAPRAVAVSTPAAASCSLSVRIFERRKETGHYEPKLANRSFREILAPFHFPESQSDTARYSCGQQVRSDPRNRERHEGKTGGIYAAVLWPRILLPCRQVFEAEVDKDHGSGDHCQGVIPAR
jgi:hypothetical protein